MYGFGGEKGLMVVTRNLRNDYLSRGKLKESPQSQRSVVKDKKKNLDTSKRQKQKKMKNES
jgi:hypothetical protein